MPFGQCKLCLKDNQLVESHLLPRGLYDLMRAPSLANPNPALITSQVVMQTSRQTKAPLLCSDCEQLLNREGEQWVLPLLATIDGDFPFLDLLQRVPPDISEEDFSAFAAVRNPAIQVSKLNHFALGIFWKASVHHWKGKGLEPRIELGPYSESIRLFLLERKPVENIALLITVLPKPVALISAIAPFENKLRINGSRYFNFYVPGIGFNLFTGKQIPEEMRGSCFYSNPGNPVIVADLSSKYWDLLRSTLKSAHVSRNLKEAAKAHRSRKRRNSPDNPET
jgi:hypothetical protein